MTSLDDAILRLQQNDQQWIAFLEEGHCVVLAPPGSGKTSLLTAKLAARLAGSPGPRGAACITMTNEAALELRKRLSRLGVQSRTNVFVGTVHSFAMARILRPFAAPAGRSHLLKLRLASNAQRRAILEEVGYEHGYERREFGTVQATVDRARQRLDLSGDVFLGGDRIAAVGREYQDLLEERGLTDFLDVVRHAVELVEEHRWIQDALAAAFPLVYVDEYQDLPPGLNRLVRAWALPSRNDAVLFAVGDPDQSIYGFTGAHPELLVDLAGAPNVELVHLERNYRSGQLLIDASLRALGEPRIIVGERADGDIQIHRALGGEPAMYLRAVELVQAAISEGTSLEEIAVLSSWGQDKDNVASALRQAGLPVFARDDSGWRATAATSLVESAAQWCAQDGTPGLALGNLAEGFAMMFWRMPNSHKMLADTIDVLLSAVPTGSASSFLQSILNAGLRDSLGTGRDEDAVEITAMQTALAEHEEASVADLGERARSPGHVMVTTIHSAKGLEFDVVVVVGTDNAAIEGFSPTTEELTEARRKFYVALTRARHVVHLVYTDRRTSGRTGNTYVVEPSALLRGLLP